MNHYEIIFTDDAITDLTELCDYIAYALLSPDTALSHIHFIHREITKLSVLPERIKTVDDEPWHSRGLRRLIVKNYFIYFRIDEQFHKVYILNVIYGKRDQLHMLAEIDD